MSGKLWTEEQFNCPVCLDLPNDPATIPCGHSYCMACIKDYWSKDESKGVYSCPQCRQTFCPKPSLSRNTMLAEAVEQLRKGALKLDLRDSVRSTSSTAPSSRSKGSRQPLSSVVPCNMCHGKQRVAVKSCLVCMSSYCEAHLKPHQTQPALKQHELIVPTGQLAQKICTQHKYLHEFYCRQCKIFVCWLCTSNEHKGHESVSTKAERIEKQKVLSEMQTDNHERLKEREKELKEMKKVMDTMKRSADLVHSDTQLVLLELQRSVERLQELVEEMLDQAGQEKMAQAQEVTESLEAKIKELRMRDRQMKELARCEDHIHYLQTCEDICSPLETEDLPRVQTIQQASYEPVRDAILDLRERIEDICNQELGKITKQVNDTTWFVLGDSSASETNSRPSPRPSPRSSSTGSQSFSRMGSISSIFRSLRHATAQATQATNTQSRGGNPWLMDSLAEIPTQVQPSLFLDQQDSLHNHTAAFPALREISIDCIQAPEPRTRDDFLQYSVTLTLDPDTAHRRLAVSEGNTKATLQGAAQPYPDTPQRFDGWTQVLCQSPLQAQHCYWEVEWRGRGSSVAVTYGSLKRKGSDANAGLGYNAQSWSLELSDTCCSAMHDNEKKDIPVTYTPRLGIFLDMPAGMLAFYSVAESMTHLHTFHANFTQPLYAAFGVGCGVGVGLDFALGQFSSTSDSIKICPM
ncbi:tripartite motif-containing protein 16-like [Lampris incognitus]|uniref:tripartite motif-containing protein 16-like n=1 Tax=Lampris incognitus TaxID=2546036 RepID=UPI0024B5D571|nr:tripartite motif-containing protein 16-like [Lampris incognitus]XP_056157657.1 tripartite motif-containing protein 16-like [Lampris incognitus]